MTSDEREMLLEMPAVQELLREEREACARLVEAQSDFEMWQKPLSEVADMIRARSKP
jgi:hypothetical protein